MFTRIFISIIIVENRFNIENESKMKVFTPYFDEFGKFA